MRLNDLQFVIGAVAHKDYEEALCHLEIRDGHAVAYGGRIAMRTPIACPLNVRPHARSLVKAVQACGNDEIKLDLTQAGRLALKAGKFKAFVHCLPNEHEMPQLRPAGEFFELTEDPETKQFEFYESIKALAPFMSIDASRPWAQGLRIGRHSTYASNNIILAQRFHGANFPRDAIIPADAVHELLRIDEVPRGVQFNEHSLTFYFEKKRWLCTHLVAEDKGWDKADLIFDKNTAEEGLEDIDPQLFDAIDTLRPFLGERGYVHLLGDRIATEATDGEGASIDAPVANGPVFHALQLRSLKGVATRINFGAYPKPCYFRGHKLRGVIVGVRV